MASAALVAIEGIDGSGKGTQVQLAVERLVASGRRAATLTFPQYERNRFGRMIGRFLNGDFGSLEQVRPELAALLFAGDRLESKPLLESALAENDVVILDRYVASNIAHQAGRLGEGERASLADFLLWLEFELYELPQPDASIWLSLPVDLAQERIAAKAARDYTDKAADLQEEDAGHLEAAASVYRSLATGPGWRTIESGSKSVDEINAEVLAIVGSLI